LLTGKQSEAVDMLTRLLAEQLSDRLAADSHYELARIAEARADTYSALNHYKSALAIPEFTARRDVLVRLGQLYFDSRIYGDAADSYREALSLSSVKSDSIRLMTKAITSLTMDGRMKDADALSERFEKRFGKDSASMAEILYYEGVHYMVEKDYDKAVKRFEHILARYENSNRCDDAAYQIPLAYFYAEKMDEAQKLFLAFPTAYPQSEFIPQSYFKLGMICHGRDEFAMAADFFTRTVDNPKLDSKTRFRAAYNAAVAYQKISSWLDAARMYEVVLKEDNKELSESSLHLKIGFCLIQGSRIDEALEHFQKADENPDAEDKPEILYWIATSYAKLGEYQKAITEYLKVPYLYSGIGKWGVTAEFEAARIYERQGEYPEAITLYKKIIRSDGEEGRFGRQAKERTERLRAVMAEKQ
jgi:tetratricopeptide (TPR) repeat protein